MGEYLLKAMAEEQGLEIEVASRGMNACKAASSSYGSFLDVSESSMEAVRDLYPNSPVFVHQPKGLKMKDLLHFDLILTMTEDHRKRIISETINSKGKEYIKGIRRKVFSLKEYAGIEPEYLEQALDVEDPMGGGSMGHHYPGIHSSSQASLRFPWGYDDDEIADAISKDVVVTGFAPGKDEPEEKEKQPYTKKIKPSYEVARNEIKECLEIILAGESPTVKQIFEIRKTRYQAIAAEKEKREIEREEKAAERAAQIARQDTDEIELSQEERALIGIDEESSEIQGYSWVTQKPLKPREEGLDEGTESLLQKLRKLQDPKKQMKGPNGHILNF